jgi:hypothetical protein
MIVSPTYPVNANIEIEAKENRRDYIAAIILGINIIENETIDEDLVKKAYKAADLFVKTKLTDGNT